MSTTDKTLTAQLKVMTSQITDKVYGCLIGGAIGDALGSPVEGWSQERIRKEYGKLDSFLPHPDPFFEEEPGAVSDDSVIRHFVCLAIVRQGGRITPDEYAETLLRQLHPDHVWLNQEIVLNKLQAGINPWISGRGSIPTPGAAMAMAPIGIVNAGDPRQAYQDGFNIGSVTQDGVHRDAAATVAAGTAEALSPEATRETVIETMLEHSSETLYRACDLSLDIAMDSNSVDEFVRRFYDDLLDWRWPGVTWDREQYRQGELFSMSTLEIIPATMGIFSICGDDADRCIVEAVNFGRDCDTIATLIGNLVGALDGASSLRQDWIDQCETVNRKVFEQIEDDSTDDFQSMAIRLVDVLKNERERAKQREAELSEILGNTQ